jgi:RNA polymerase sigma-70 factor (ECF subfamily)
MSAARKQNPPSARAEEADAVLERLRAGDGEAFNVVYGVYRARLFSFLVRLTRSEPLARDLTQETWLRLAAHARSLKPDTDLGAWLFTVARNLFVCHRRWALLDRERLEELGLLPPRASVPTPLQALALTELERRLERALAALPREQREVVLLVSVEGFAPKDVARMLDLSPDAIRQRLARGRKALAAATGDEASFEGPVRGEEESAHDQ